MGSRLGGKEKPEKKFNGQQAAGKRKTKKKSRTNHNNMTRAQKSKRNGQRVKGQKKNLNG
jgi:hypothetical protein